MTDIVPVTSSGVFVDTSAYFAAANRRDAGHNPVAALMRTLVQGRRLLITTNFILAELHALLLTRLDRRIAARVLAEIDASELTTVERVSARDERRAREIVFGYTDKDFSLTDAISFAVMERLRVSHAFTLDRNLPSSAGSCSIPPLVPDPLSRWMRCSPFGFQRRRPLSGRCSPAESCCMVHQGVLTVTRTRGAWRVRPGADTPQRPTNPPPPHAAAPEIAPGLLRK